MVQKWETRCTAASATRRPVSSNSSLSAVLAGSSPGSTPPAGTWTPASGNSSECSSTSKSSTPRVTKTSAFSRQPCSPARRRASSYGIGTEDCGGDTSESFHSHPNNGMPAHEVRNQRPSPPHATIRVQPIAMTSSKKRAPAALQHLAGRPAACDRRSRSPTPGSSEPRWTAPPPVGHLGGQRPSRRQHLRRSRRPRIRAPSRQERSDWAESCPQTRSPPPTAADPPDDYARTRPISLVRPDG